MFRHYRVIVRELVLNALPSYTIVSNASRTIVVEISTTIV